MSEFIRKFFDVKFWKFIGVGVINTLVGSAVSYVLNKKFTFQNKQKSSKTLLRFVVSISACYLLAYGVAKPLAMMVLSGAPANIQENLGMLFGMGFFVVLNYIGQRFFAFKEDKEA